MAYDAIVVGGRVAGASTALLLARAGLEVLVLERAHLPSDTLSSHQLQVPGVARLARWGLLDRLLATGAPPTRDVRFAAGEAVINARMPQVGDVDFLLSPRRTVLDSLLLEAAQEAGAKVREGASVEELVEQDGRVAGVRYRLRGTGGGGEERATVVVGADGRHSAVARLAGATAYRQRPATAVAAYAYWSAPGWTGGEISSQEAALAGAWPTHGDEVVSFISLPAARWDDLRADPEGTLRATLAGAGTVGERLRGAELAGPVRCTNDLDGTVRVPFGPGWVLVGDAGLVMDPVTGLGMGHALRDAELVAAAVSSALGDEGRLARALRGYQKQRDRETLALFDMTAGLAEFRPRPAAERRLFAAVADDPAAGNRFIAAITGATPVSGFFNPVGLIRLVGVRGMLELARSRPR